VRALARALGAALAACAIAFPLAAPCASQAERGRLEDFDAMWRAIDRGYAFFDAGRSPWRRAREAWRPRAAQARSRGEFIAALRGALEELHDDYVTLAADELRSPRIPYDIDIRALAPDVEIKLTAPQGGPGDPILYQALKRLEKPASPALSGRSAPR